MSHQLAVLESVEHLISHAVLRGRIEVAREWAIQYARVRDDGLTTAELFAALGRSM